MTINARIAAVLTGVSLLIAAPPVFASPAVAPAHAGAATVPPGFNVHRIVESSGHEMWRGGAPRPDTLKALAAAATARGTTVTLIDLRHPDNSDDRSGKGGRLSPTAERKKAEQMGMRYVSVSALDKKLTDVLAEALKSGDVYIHCMYGVNRTGFATARFAVSQKITVGRDGLGTRDYNDGAAFEKAREKR